MRALSLPCRKVALPNFAIRSFPPPEARMEKKYQMANQPRDGDHIGQGNGKVVR